MQQNKITTNFSELETIISNSEKLTSSLTEVMSKFNTSKHFSLFNSIKSKGIAVSNLMNILMLLPFHTVSNIYSLIKYGLHGADFAGKKDAYYDVKNNEYISWRTLLLLHAKRFIYLTGKNANIKTEGVTAIIFDDTLIEKTGKKIEKVGIVHDHVSGRFILGFKILVCGFWDGASFIPLDFSIHREKGKQHKVLIKAYHKAVQNVNKEKTVLSKQVQTVERKKQSFLKVQQEFNIRTQPSKTCNKKHELALNALKKVEAEYEVIQNNMNSLLIELSLAKKALKKYYDKERLYGLTAKERKEQYKKAVSVKSHGFKRRKEAEKDKISTMILMLGRVVKCGVIPNYVLIDSWFFCFDVLEKLANLKNGALKLIAMVKVNNQIFTICSSSKDMTVKAIIQKYEREAKKCNKLKAHYFCVKSLYRGIRVNLFFVRMGKCQTWHLLLTTDLEIGFIKLMEAYQIRWSIEVFFKESKQYLKLGACQSANFDAQIADVTISLMQHIMLSYFKRINYQQSIGGLFKELSNEIVELDLITRLISMFWELIELFCTITSIDVIEFQKEAIKDDRIMKKLAMMMPQNVLRKAA